MNVKERLSALAQYAGKTKTALALHVGSSLNAFNVYYKREAIPAKVIKAILEKYPEVSAEWIEYGEGTMLVEGYDPSKVKNASFLMEDSVETVDCYIKGMPCDTYLRVNGFAIEPTICNGDLIGIRAEEYDTIDPAKYYLVVNKVGIPTIKRIVGVDDENIYVSVGEANIKPFQFAKANLKGIFRIVFVGRSV